MSKIVDDNGFWKVNANPLSKVGVFPYLGKQISDKLEPNRIYMVYRPAEELFSKDAIDSFNENPVPLIENHEMIGKGFKPAEEKGLEGVVTNIRREGDRLVGDISIYSDRLKKKISEGKKDLSMGYFCNYELKEGDWQGHHYDAIQRDMRSNHIALVDRGRMGGDVRVYDSFSFDCAIAQDVLERFILNRTASLVGKTAWEAGSVALLFMPTHKIVAMAKRLHSVYMAAGKIKEAAQLMKAVKQIKTIKKVFSKDGIRLAKGMIAKARKNGTFARWTKMLQNALKLDKLGLGVKWNKVIKKTSKLLSKPIKLAGKKLNKSGYPTLGKLLGYTPRGSATEVKATKSILDTPIDKLPELPEWKEAMALISSSSAELASRINRTWKAISAGMVEGWTGLSPNALARAEAEKVAKLSVEARTIEYQRQATLFGSESRQAKAILNTAENPEVQQAMRNSLGQGNSVPSLKKIVEKYAHFDKRAWSHFLLSNNKKAWITRHIDRFRKKATLSEMEALNMDQRRADAAISKLNELGFSSKTIDEKILANPFHDDKFIQSYNRLVEEISSMKSYHRAKNISAKTKALLNILENPKTWTRIKKTAKYGSIAVGAGGVAYLASDPKKTKDKVVKTLQEMDDSNALQNSLAAATILSGTGLVYARDIAKLILPRKQYRRFSDGLREIKQDAASAAAAGAITPWATLAYRAFNGGHGPGVLKTAGYSVMTGATMAFTGGAVSAACRLMSSPLKAIRSVTRKVKTKKALPSEPLSWITVRGKHIPIYEENAVGLSKRGRPKKTQDEAISMDKNEDIQWITVRGQHIPIKKGQSVKEGVKQFFASKKNNKPRRTHNSISHDLMHGSMKNNSLIKSKLDFPLTNPAKISYKGTLIKQAGKPIDQTAVSRFLKKLPHINELYQGLRSRSSKEAFIISASEYARYTLLAACIHKRLPDLPRAEQTHYKSILKDIEKYNKKNINTLTKIVSEDARKKRD